MNFIINIFRVAIIICIVFIDYFYSHFLSCFYFNNINNKTK